MASAGVSFRPGNEEGMMDNASLSQPSAHDVRVRGVPIHLWIVGGLSLLWSGFGSYDYLMTRMRNTDYLAEMMPGIDPQATLAWIDAFPFWAQFGWGLGVWMGLVGSLLLLIRNRYAVHAFGLSLLGAVLGLGYQLALAPPLPGADDPMMVVMPYIIIVVAMLLFGYARAMSRRALLR
jgi:hypothetical protein